MSIFFFHLNFMIEIFYKIYLQMFLTNKNNINKQCVGDFAKYILANI